MESYKPVSVYVKFKNSIFNDMNKNFHTFNLNEWDVQITEYAIEFTEKAGKEMAESILIPWDNVVVVRMTNLLEKTS